MNLEIIQSTTPDELRREIESAKVGEIIRDKMGEAEFIEAALQLLKTPALSKCTKESVFGGILKAAIFGFRLSPELGQCWLVPRKVKTGNRTPDGKDEYANVAVFQIGYKGWQELAFRSNVVESFDFGSVYEKDEFDYQQGTSPYLNYRPAKDQRNKGKRTHFFATATLSTGRVVFDVITVDEAETYRRYSDSQFDGYGRDKQFAAAPKDIWAQHYDSMALRLPIREICTKKVPKSPIILKAIETDGGVSNLSNGQVIDITPKTVDESAAAPETLHPDYIDEIEACKTADEIKAVFERQKNNVPESLKAQYYNLCIEANKKLPK